MVVRRQALLLPILLRIVSDSFDLLELPSVACGRRFIRRLLHALTAVFICHVLNPLYLPPSKCGMSDVTAG